MPVAGRGDRSGGARQLTVLGFATIGALAAMWFLVSRSDDLASSGDLELNLGSSVFEAGQVDRLAEDIADKGPLFFGDLVGRDRDIYLQHIGDEPDEGWYAFAARPLDAARDCFVEWDPDAGNFVDNCSGTIYPADGEGLPAYPVSIDADGILSVDINAAERDIETDIDE